MKKSLDIFALFYLIFVVSIAIGGSLYLGIGTMRQYMSVIMALFFGANVYLCKRHIDHTIVLYLLFIACYGFSSIIEDNFSEFLRNLISKYAVAIIGFFTSLIFYAKIKSFKLVYATIFILGLFNAIITVFQYLGNDLAAAIGRVFVDMSSGSNERMFEIMMAGETGRFSFGILGDVVQNGYFSALLPFIALMYFRREHNLVLYSFYFVVFIFSLFAVFATQERSSFILVGIFSSYYFYKRDSTKRLVILAISAIILLLPDIINSTLVQESRFVGRDSESRYEIYERAFTFIQQNPFGGAKSAITYIGSMSHNFVFNAFIYGGYIGGLVGLYVIYYQTRKAIKIMQQGVNIEICMAFLVYTLNGFFHNPSIITGDAMTWILWAMVLAEYIKPTFKRIS